MPCRIMSENHMLQDATNWAATCEEAAKAVPYNYPGLRKHSFFLDFLERLRTCGVLSFTSRARGRVRAFAVSKKSKEVDGVLMEK